MKRKSAVFLLLFICLPIFGQLGQSVIMGGGLDVPLEELNNVTSDTIERSTIKIMTVGIKHFNHPLPDLNAADSLKLKKEFQEIHDDFLKYSYKNRPKPITLDGKVKMNEIIKYLNDLSEKATEDDVVIIYLLSHGDTVNGEYYFICSDTNTDMITNTAISGETLRSYFKKMADKGALVLVFLDTCHAAAIADNVADNEKSKPQGNGSVVYFTSSLRDEKALQINEDTRFRQSVIDIFKYKKGYANVNGYITVTSIESHIASALQSSGIKLQTPSVMKFPNNTDLGNYPILKVYEFKEYHKIWDYSKPWNPFYVSPGGGKNLDVACVGIECVSTVGLLTCGFLQEHYKDLIKKGSSDPLQAGKNNQYRISGRNASYGCWCCAGLLVGSYLFRAVHVHHSLKRKFMKDYDITGFSVNPLFSTDMNGMYLAINF